MSGVDEWGDGRERREGSGIGRGDGRYEQGYLWSWETWLLAAEVIPRVHGGLALVLVLVLVRGSRS